MASSNGVTARQPLKGYRILDFSWVGAGPHAAELMALLGAEVIKIETSVRPDSARIGFFFTAPGLDESPNFNCLNLNKQSLTLNLRDPNALTIARELVAISDGVVDAFRAGVMARLGLDYPTLRRVNPSIVMMSISSYGATGPYAGYPGNAGIFGAMSGVSHLAGYSDQAPSTLFEPPDMRAGLTAFSAFMAALHWRRRTGRGQFIDVSATEANAALIGHTFVDYALNNRSAMRQGNRHPWMAPHSCYSCTDENTWVAIAVGSDAEWGALVSTMGNPPWAADPRFIDAAGRWQHQEDIDLHIEAWTRMRTAEEVEVALQAAGVAATATKDVRALASDEHLRDRGLFVETLHPKIGPAQEIGLPWLIDGGAAQAKPSPLLGQHTRQLMGELLAKTESQIQTLAQAGALQ